MKIILLLTLAALITLTQTGCETNAGVSAGHDDHRHGVSTNTHAHRGNMGAGMSVQ